jgi:hypothetical protein
LFLDLREKIIAVKLNSTKNKQINTLNIKNVISTWSEAILMIKQIVSVMINNIDETIKSLRKTV